MTARACRSVRPEFSTTMYEFAHGKKPRGVGHWAFWIRPWRGAPDSRSDLFFASPNRSLPQAREEAICRAYDLWAGDGATYIEVAS